MPTYDEDRQRVREISAAGVQHEDFEAITPEVVQRTLALLDALEGLGVPAPYVYPSPEGWWSIEWDEPALWIMVERETFEGIGPGDTECSLLTAVEVAAWVAAHAGVGR